MVSLAINPDVLAFHEAIVTSEGQSGLGPLAVGRSSSAVNIGQTYDTPEICNQGRLAACARKEKMNDRIWSGSRLKWQMGSARKGFWQR